MGIIQDGMVVDLHGHGKEINLHDHGKDLDLHKNARKKNYVDEKIVGK
jgi:hypothetical protein